MITSGSDARDKNENETCMENLSLKDPMKRIFTLGKINRTLNSYTNAKKLSSLDKRLLKGFYVTEHCYDN